MHVHALQYYLMHVYMYMCIFCSYDIKGKIVTPIAVASTYRYMYVIVVGKLEYSWEDEYGWEDKMEILYKDASH